jgi:hypothetical protein
MIRKKKSLMIKKKLLQLTMKCERLHGNNGTTNMLHIFSFFNLDNGSHVNIFIELLLNLVKPIKLTWCPINIVFG